MATEIKSARDALEKCYEIALQWEADELAGVAGTTDKPEARSASEALLEIERLCKSALALPRLNCEVGTADEQGERMRTFCLSHEGCHSCEFGTIPLLTLGQCVLEWAQMPYKADAQKGGAE